MGVEIHDPIADLVDVALQVHPGLACTVGFVAEVAGVPDALGVTIFPDDGGLPQILIRVDLPLEGVVEVLAHEFAHVIAGQAEDHGPRWEDAFGAIHAAWIERAGLPDDFVVTRC